MTLLVYQIGQLEESITLPLQRKAHTNLRMELTAAKQ
jgi:hypothetical protein